MKFYYFIDFVFGSLYCMKLHIFWCLMYIPYFLTILLLLILIQNFGFIVLSLQTLPNISLPWNLMTTSIDVLFNTCLWINLMSAIYWMCYMFHSICGKRKPWIMLNGQGTNWSQPCHSHCWFYHRHPVIKWPFEIQKFYHPKNTNHYYCSPSFKHWFIGPKKLSCFIFWQRSIYIL